MGETQQQSWVAGLLDGKITRRDVWGAIFIGLGVLKGGDAMDKFRQTLEPIVPYQQVDRVDQGVARTEAKIDALNESVSMLRGEVAALAVTRGMGE